MQKLGPYPSDLIELARKMRRELRGNVATGGLSMHETTPFEITADIVDLCAELGGGTPMFVDVSAPPTSRVGWCFSNVAHMVSDKGGVLRNGWLIWLARGLWLNAEFHSVWQAPDGGLLDVTPKPDGERNIMFMPDPTYGPDFDFYRRPNSVRMRVYRHDERRDDLTTMIAAFSDVRLSYETVKAFSKGLTVAQSVGMGMKRDRLEKLLDGFLEDVGILESMLVPTPNGMVCKDPRREDELVRRARAIDRQKTDLFLMTDMIAGGMLPDIREG
jgi:hypothetical protein